MGYRCLDLVGLRENAGLRVRLAAQGVVDARRHITFGAEPCQHIFVVGLVTHGETARMEVDHQAIAVFATGGEVEVKLVGLALTIGEIDFPRTQCVTPPDGICFAPGGLDKCFGCRSGSKGQQERQDTRPNRHSPPLLFLHSFAHRKFPPNSVPPTKRFHTLRTASRPRTNAATTMAARISRLFCVNVIPISSLDRIHVICYDVLQS